MRRSWSPKSLGELHLEGGAEERLAQASGSAYLQGWALAKLTL